MVTRERGAEGGGGVRSYHTGALAKAMPARVEPRSMFFVASRSEPQQQETASMRTKIQKNIKEARKFQVMVRAAQSPIGMPRCLLNHLTGGATP